MIAVFVKGCITVYLELWQKLVAWYFLRDFVLLILLKSVQGLLYKSNFGLTITQKGWHREHIMDPLRILTKTTKTK